MILRTPPAKRTRGGVVDANAIPITESPQLDHHHLVINEDNSIPPLQPCSDHPSSPEQLLCTYQCRQLVLLNITFVTQLLLSSIKECTCSSEKEARDYQSKLKELNENFSKSGSWLVEQELAAAKGREHALQNQLVKEVTLENEKNLLQKAESSAASAEEKASVLEGKLSHLSESIEREKKCFNNELEQMNREPEHSVSRIRAELEKMECCRARHVEKESELLKEQIEDLGRQLTECLHQRSELEKRLSSFIFQEGSTDSTILVKHLQEELRNYLCSAVISLISGQNGLGLSCDFVFYSNVFVLLLTFDSERVHMMVSWVADAPAESEVREARERRSSYENIELLKEKLFEEKSCREKVESELSKSLEFELNMKKLEDELSSWKSVIKDILGVSCHEDMTVNFYLLILMLKFCVQCREVIDNMMNVGETNAHLKQMEVALDTAQFSKQNAETEYALTKEMAEALKLEVKQIELMGYGYKPMLLCELEENHRVEADHFNGFDLDLK
ncbi:hypothetical protein DKX38_001692 [Salix brachista]|uniref:Uncharacterized protein n=1 Tax=Salix brachista TaxID=2182728 RepID=A0A5N5P5I6_9ROSI|nr:hypothetical protein DKX38_001692 [Salix brachista]